MIIFQTCRPTLTRREPEREGLLTFPVSPPEQGRLLLRNLADPLKPFWNRNRPPGYNPDPKSLRLTWGRKRRRFTPPWASLRILYYGTVKPTLVLADTSL